MPGTAVLTQEQEQVVADARMGMGLFDSKPPLLRWLANYAPEHGAFFWSSDWHVVTREGRHWKVEIGYTNTDTVHKTLTIDGRAPAPPVMEHRPPKPEPVKPREASLPPMRVPSAMEYIESMLSWSEVQELHQRIRERQRRRRPVYASPRFISFDEGMPDFTPLRYAGEELSPSELMALAHQIMDRRFRQRPPPTPRPQRPAPPPTRRNQ